MSVTVTPLSESASVQLDADGNGTARLGPASALEVWRPINAHVSVSTAVKEATCTIYVGDNPGQPSTFRDSTFTGSSGDTTDSIKADVVLSGFHIYAVWTGGDAQAIAAINVTGVREFSAG